MNRLIIVGSPRTNGRSAALGEQLFEACIEDCPNDEVALVSVASLEIGGCNGCDSCQALMANRSSEADADEEAPRCTVADDMADVYPLIEAADEITVVSPVYFSGTPSQLKALLDRFQPYFWTNARKQPLRPAILHVVGEGGDPYGYEPLIGTVKSALVVAGFQLETVLDWVGKIDENGEITEDAGVYNLIDVEADEAAGDYDPDFDW